MTNNFTASLAYPFRDPALLQTALTHRSYANEHPQEHVVHNERLEYLGDAVLELVVSEYLYRQFPEKPEGELTSLRAALVNTVMLSRVATDLDLNAHMRLSRGEAQDQGKGRQYILANAIEALIGALYLDGGMGPASDFIHTRMIPYLPAIMEQRLYKDAKSLFQEEAQERVGLTPSYHVLSETGPDHNKIFEVGAYLGEEMVASGRGSSKQEAQQEAARLALQAKQWETV